MNAFTAAAGDLASQFTDRKVYIRLAALLPDRPFTGCAWDRWSIVGDQAGIATQVRTTTKLYPNDPDVAAYTAIPEEAFDPARADLAAKYGLVWIRLSDITPWPSPTNTSAVSGQGSTPSSSASPVPR